MKLFNQIPRLVIFAIKASDGIVGAFGLAGYKPLEGSQRSHKELDLETLWLRLFFK